MSDIFDLDDEAAAGNARAFSVSELSGAVKKTLEGAFGRVRVRGEVGRVSRPRSGHVYLDLKDDRAVLASVIWKGAVAGLGMEPAEGDEVVAEGRLTTFAGQSRYQLVIDRMAYAGVGGLLAKLERLKAALAAEGLFDAARKRRPPFLPAVVGVVTSPSGAVIRDILHRLADRFPMRVLVWPVAVQGAACAGEVSAAVRGFNALPAEGPVPRPDVLIVARGGGSVEDLWGFNEEAVARAVADSAIPVISAVGHETDTTLADFAADLRAPTPTAAAEMAAPVRRELAAALAALEERRRRAANRLLGEARLRRDAAARLLPSAAALTEAPRQRLDLAAAGLPRGLRAMAGAKRQALLARPSGRFGPALLRQAILRRQGELQAAAGRLRPSVLAQAAALGRERLAGLGRRAGRAAAERARAARDRMERLRRLLESLSHAATLARGFAIVRGADDAPVTRAADAPQGAVSLQFADGRVEAAIGAAPAKPARRKPAARDGGQGSLF